MQGKGNSLKINFFFLSLTLLTLIVNVEALYFLLIPGSDECIFFKTERGDRILGSYEVDSEHESVRVSLSRVDGAKIFDKIKNTGDFHFDAQENSEYSLCFKNLLNSVEQTVNFSVKSISSNTSSLSSVMSNQESRKLVESMKSLHEKVVVASEKQKYSLTRKRYQMEIIESSRRRATFWSVLELLVSFAFVFLQVYILKSYFNIKYLV